MCLVCRLERRWIEVTADTQVDALIDAVKYGLKSKDHDAPKRTMVFTNTVDAANSVSDILQRVGISCILYHRESSLEERANNLQSFRENGGVLVCTDAAARGLDVPNVSHVIQVCSNGAVAKLNFLMPSTFVVNIILLKFSYYYGKNHANYAYKIVSLSYCSSNPATF